jgi:hypothetical protein
MGWKPKKGDLVKTQFGPGIVEKISFEKFFVRIIEGNIEGYMNIDEIEPLETKKDSITKSSISTPINNPAFTAPNIVLPENKELNTSYHSRTCIDALRFGLVPDDDLKKLTIGYRNIEKWVISSRPKFEPAKKEKQSIVKPVVNQIIGQYGDGKSHIMSTIRYIAKKKGYLIARTEVDGNKVSFSNPNTLLYSLWRNLEGEDLSEATPLLDLFCKAIHSGYDLPKTSFLDSDRIRKMYYLIKKLDGQGDLDNVRFLINDLLSCNDRINATEAKKILKEETRLSSWDLNNEVSPIVSSRVMERPYTFIESIIGTAILSREAGYKGLIILIDEFEVEVSLLGTNAQRDRFKGNLNMLVQYMTGKMPYPGTSLGIYFATAGKELDFGSKYIDEMVSGFGGDKYEIKPIMDWDLDNPEIIRFVDNVHQIYQEAYPHIEDSDFDLIPALDKMVQNEQIYESGGIRYFVKQYIGMLDRKYGPPLNN